ncbi:MULTISPECIES: S1 family peptidase [Kitasatospora]|uniref:S1 family peptidase n=1 Tax=Kitasatospora TaxID=2063 RepID=UPI000C7030B2|nr:serine protease [Kitasatospora sp. GP30]MDH6139222.1 V8-like Glu-specific endopeptidase [Kitasatospora sp. GP30]
MKLPLSGALAVTLLASAGTLAVSAPAQAAPAPARALTAHASAAQHAPHAANVTFAGTVALDDCSGSIVRMPNSQGADPALVMTNGHCLESGMPNPGQVITNQPSSRDFTLLDDSGNSIGDVQASSVVYSTMTNTDVTIYQLPESYDDIQQQYGISPLTISANHPTAGTPIEVVSGYWQATYGCNIDGFVYQLKEGDWTWKDSVRYTSSCNTIGGTSGSPVIDTNTGLVVAVNNTGNENGERCTVDNPCEVDANGNVTVHQGTNYAEETYEIPACFAPGNKLDLTLAGCTLPQ